MEIFDNMPFQPEIEEDHSLASFDADWQPKIETNWMGRRKPLDPRTKDRVRFYWDKLRVAVRQNGLLNELEIERDAKLDRNFGLRSKKLLVESDEEIEIDDSKKIVTLADEAKQKRLPWYLLSDASQFSKFQKLFVQMMTWSTVIITPLTFLFPDLKKSTINYEWFVDSVWLVEIFLSFFKGHLVYAKTFEMAAKRYLFFGPLKVGAFWFDAFSTIPPMIFKE